MPVRNRLRAIRHELQIDHQTEMAERLGLQHQQYNRYERQQVQPSLEMALRIARRLGRPVEEIFYLDDDPPGE